MPWGRQQEENEGEHKVGGEENGKGEAVRKKKTEKSVRHSPETRRPGWLGETQCTMRLCVAADSY